MHKVCIIIIKKYNLNINRFKHVSCPWQFVCTIHFLYFPVSFYCANHKISGVNLGGRLCVISMIACLWGRGRGRVKVFRVEMSIIFHDKVCFELQKLNGAITITSDVTLKDFEDF